MRLVWAFAISVAFHLLFFGGYHLGERLHWWDNARWPAWLAPIKKLTQALKPPDIRQPPAPKEVPLLFVEVSPVQETAEPPKDAKYYSSRNSQAANPEPDKETDTPRITGEQTRVVKTEDVPRNKFTPLQPVAPAPQDQEEQEEQKPKPTPPPGDLALGKPEQRQQPTPGDAPRPRPRTIKEAKARMADNRLAGEKMKQEGGVRRHLEISSLDAKATLTGAYDYAFIQAVQQRWYALLDDWNYSAEGRGKVVLQFQLHSDGRISEMKVSENTVSEVLALICEKAVLDPAPYDKWSKEMRLNLEDPRKVQFTFYYD
jgi:hypothetical protein